MIFETLRVLQLTDILGGADRNVAVRPDGDRTAQLEKAAGVEGAVAEVGFRGRTQPGDAAAFCQCFGLFGKIVLTM